MTYYQESLIDQAMVYWEKGEPVPLNLFASMAAEGLDVEALEAKHIQN